jgi:predicted MFS family arabinose efflux permease
VTERRTDRAPAIAALLLVLIATGSLSQFFRTSNAVIAPELIRDLGLSPPMLGTANSAFFLALLILQIPTGIAFDRLGVRATVAALSVLMAAGAALHALAVDGVGLIAARFLVGLGCAGSFMAAVVLVPRFVERSRWSTVLGWVFGASQAGYFLAGAPLAHAAATIGWRLAFLGLAVLAVGVGMAVWLCVRDHPPGHSGAVRRDDAQGVMAGIAAVWAQPGMPQIFALFGVAYASMFAVAGLWIGPYLSDVHGLDTIARGHVLTLVALALVAGNLGIGPLERRIGKPKRIVLASGSLAVAALLVWAVMPTPPVSAAIGLLLLLCLASSYGPVILSQIRARVPDHLAGRGATTANMAQLSGTAALPIVTGFVPAWFGATAAGGYDPDAYRVIFGMLAVVLATGLAVYARLRD